MFLHSRTDVLRTVLVGSLAYLGLLLFVRISGKRTLASMNAFDFVVTVALGSTLATILLSSDVALAEGLAAFATLIGLQFVITWLSVRTDWVSAWSSRSRCCSHSAGSRCAVRWWPSA